MKITTVSREHVPAPEGHNVWTEVWEAVARSSVDEAVVVDGLDRSQVKALRTSCTNRRHQCNVRGGSDGRFVAYVSKRWS